MSALKRFLREDTAMVNMIEAIMSAIILISALCCLDYGMASYGMHQDKDLKRISGDVLYVLMYRENTPGQPGLAHVMSSKSEWSADSGMLLTCIDDMLPEDIHCFLISPYGNAGEIPPDRVSIYAGTFEAYDTETGKIVSGKLILWRV